MSKPVITEYTRWGLKWRSQNHAQGRSEHICWLGDSPTLFRTRREARAFQHKQYAYIRTRRGFKAEPHGWKLPAIIRIRVTLEEKL